MEIDKLKTALNVILPNTTKQGWLNLALPYRKYENHIQYFRCLFEAFPELTLGLEPTSLPQSYAIQLAQQGYIVYMPLDIEVSDAPTEALFYLPEEMTTEQAYEVEKWKEAVIKNKVYLEISYIENGQLQFLEDDNYEKKIRAFQELIDHGKREKNR